MYLKINKRLLPLRLQTIGFDPLVSIEDAATSNIEWLPLEQLWPRADFITVHTPLIAQTKG